MLSIIHFPEKLKNIYNDLQKDIYDLGHSHAVFYASNSYKESAKHPISYDLAGRLVITSSNYGILEVPQALVNGIFDVLYEPGVQLSNVLFDKDKPRKAHIVVFYPKEIESLGGPEKIKERGHYFHYTLGPLRIIKNTGSNNYDNKISKLWVVEIKSNELESLRKSYGLSEKPFNNKYPFHILIALKLKKNKKNKNVKKADAPEDDQNQKESEGEEEQDARNIGSFLPFTSILGRLARWIIFPYIREISGAYDITLSPDSINFFERLMNTRRAIYQQHSLKSDPSIDYIDKMSRTNAIFGLLRSMGLVNQDNFQSALRFSYNLSNILGGRDISRILNLAYPEFWDHLHGWRGSIGSFTRAMAMADATRRDPSTGFNFYDADISKENAKKIFKNIYMNLDEPRLTGGMSAGKLGDLYQKAIHRGLLSGQFNDPDKLSQSLSGLSQAVTASDDLLSQLPYTAPYVVSAGSPVQEKSEGYSELLKQSSALDFLLKPMDKDRHKDIDKNLDLLYKITQYQLANLDPKEVANYIYQVANLSQTTPGGLLGFVNILSRSGNLLDNYGLPRVLSLSTTPGTAAFASSWNELAGKQGFNGLTPEEAIQLDNRLRIAAASSPMANMLAATLILYEAGFIQPGTVGEEMVEAIKRGDYVTESGILLGRLPPAEWVRLMGASGVSPATAWEQLQAQQTNYEMLMRTNLIDVVRRAQFNFDIKPFLFTVFNRSANRNLAALPLPQNVKHQMSYDLSNYLINILENIDPGSVIRPTKDSVDEITKLVIQQNPTFLNELGEDGLRSVIHSVLTHTDNFIRADPRFSAYKNLNSLLAVHRPDIMNAATLAQSAAKTYAGIAQSMAHIDKQPFISKLISAFQRQSPLEINSEEQRSFVRPMVEILGGAKNDRLRQALQDFVSKEMKNPEFANLPASLRDSFQKGQAEFISTIPIPNPPPPGQEWPELYKVIKNMFFGSHQGNQMMAQEIPGLFGNYPIPNKNQAAAINNTGNVLFSDTDKNNVDFYSKPIKIN